MDERGYVAAMAGGDELNAKVIGRLGRELGDGALARTIIDRNPALVTPLAARPALASMTPPTAAPRNIAALVVFAFGNRIDGGVLGAGPVNESLARTVESFAEARSIPIYAQWEVAELLAVRCHVIRPDVGDDGKETYLSTEGVVVAALRLSMPASGVGVVAFADHAVRCVMTCRKHGVDAAVPAGIELPRTYDPQSGQAWTRDRATYVAVDLFGRLALE